ncbi:MAG: aminotransferase class V-fold PLP-dependent enzyme [Thermovenabulum sp.]|uniref:aminotransferase class V-fold PLP-dependent enzyme n=1 Tax=Thermovenabulum sp. TaxID=3100335 RepID=UPI003C7CF49E
MNVIYFDNAATSFPKPERVINAMQNYFKNIGASPGRGGYKNSINAGRIIFETRSKLKKLFNAPKEENIIFTLNVTHAINYSLNGFLNAGDHVITTSMEHNSVIRPLRFLEKYRNIELTIINCDKNGILNPDDIRKAIKKNTKLIALTHASNVTGTVMPIEEVAKIKKENGVVLLLDTAQTAGFLDIDFKKLDIDILAFTGHKSLLGPQGTGGLVLSDNIAKTLIPFIHGGTGSKSEIEFQPDFLPDKFEAGTPNTIGIAGLSSAVDFLEEEGLNKIRNHELELTKQFIEGIIEIPKIKIHGLKNIENRVSTVSITVDNIDPAFLAYKLDNQYNIMVRPGLHCAPLAHKTIGTFPYGTLRFSFGYFNTKEEVDFAIKALIKIIEEGE